MKSNFLPATRENVISWISGEKITCPCGGTLVIEKYNPQYGNPIPVFCAGCNIRLFIPWYYGKRDEELQLGIGKFKNFDRRRMGIGSVVLVSRTTSGKPVSVPGRIIGTIVMVIRTSNDIWLRVRMRCSWGETSGNYLFNQLDWIGGADFGGCAQDDYTMPTSRKDIISALEQLGGSVDTKRSTKRLLRKLATLKAGGNVK